MIHIDAHPDLLCPISLSSSDFADPRRLVEYLEESEAGIAEFIVPLVFNGFISNILWIRPPCASQFASGVFNIEYGVAGDLVRTSLPHEYYVVEGLYAPSEVLQHVKACELQVMRDDDDKTTLGSCDARPTGEDCWLDICLDHFVTRNPFAGDIQHLCTSVNVDFAKVRDAFLLPSYRNPFGSGLDAGEKNSLAGCLQQHKALFDECIASVKAAWRDGRRLPATAVTGLATELSSQLKTAGVYPPAVDVEGLWLAVLQLMNRCTSSQRATILEGGPLLDLPTVEFEQRHAVQPYIDARFREVTRHLETLFEAKPAGEPFDSASGRCARSPALITVALSVSDGYISPVECSYVLRKCLLMLHNLFGAGPAASLQQLVKGMGGGACTEPSATAAADIDWTSLFAGLSTEAGGRARRMPAVQLCGDVAEIFATLPPTASVV